MDKVIMQIPKIADNKRCHFCDCKVERTTDKSIIVYNKKHNKQKEIIRPLFYCKHCDLFYISYKQYEVTLKMYGYTPERFSIKDEYSLSQVRAKILSPPVWSFNYKTVKHKNKKENLIRRNNKINTKSSNQIRPINSVNLQKLPKSIYKTNYTLYTCPACKHKLMDYVNVIPINQLECMSFKGKYCASCERFYEEGFTKIEKIIENNPAAIDYEIRYDYLIPNYSKRYDEFCELETPIVFAVLYRKENNEYRYISIVHNQEENDISRDILHYSDYVSRAILTSLFYKKETVTLNDKSYVISKICTEDEILINDFNFLLKDIKLKKGGGYANYNRDEVVDVLLFSPRTQIFEIIRASYNKKEDDYYMDIKIFRKFINSYGNPGLPILFSSSNSSDFTFSYLKEESLLHAYGYNVNQSDSLSDSYRWKLLSEIIDLKLMTPYEIINLLNYNINSHSAYKYIYARMKWKKDIEFVSNYKINPNRFIVAGKVKK